MSLSISLSGSFDNLDKFLNSLTNGQIFKSLASYGERGAAALAAATPGGGAAADSWSYEVVGSNGYYGIWWTNSHVDEYGTPIVVLLETGHGTGTGGYVQGKDFINPAIQPVMDEIANAFWKEVTSS